MINELLITTKESITSNNWYALLYLSAGFMVLYLLSLKVLIPFIHYIITRSPTKIDNALMNRNVFRRLVLLPSLFFAYQYSYLISEHRVLITRIVSAVLIWVLILAFDKFLLAVNDIYEKLPRAKGKPIKGFVQIVEIIAYLFGLVGALAVLMGKSPWVFLSGLGAMTAVLMLVFKDTILSLVASVRITANGLIEIGDWIEMPQYRADGDVIDIALHSIQVQNWDKTITSIPTHKLIDEAFINWKGMQLAGGRRIMRNIVIDIGSIKFCDNELLAKLEKIILIKDYLDAKKKEISQYNKKNGIIIDDYTNGRHLTNIGTFRAYISQYIKTHPQINHRLLTLIRQLQPDSTGLPVQVYTFANTTSWGEYEDIQSDIFDHLLAIIPSFELRVFQYPSGKDIRKIKLNDTQN